jgi:hypothetical protein
LNARLRAAGWTVAVFIGMATPAAADTLGIRPLGGDYESGRTVGKGNWAVEGGVWVPTFGAPTTPLSAEDTAILDNWQVTPAYPEIRGIYGLNDGNEAVAMIGPVIGGGYRRFFLRADAPWPGEYLQALIQLGGGFEIASRKAMGYVRFPAIFEAGPFTLHVAGGGYYLFNNQPIVDADIGMEYTLFEHFQVGAMAKLRMDSAKITPLDGQWSFGGGLRYQVGPRFVIQADLNQDSGPPIVPTALPHPRIEFPFQSLRASAGYYF